MKGKKSFALGYSLVIHSILMYFLAGALTTSGMNVWNTAFSNANGWNVSVLLTMATVASLIGIIGSIVFGDIVAKKGARLMIAITLIITGITVIVFGQIKVISLYLVCMAIFNFMSNGFCSIGSNAVVGNWFPAKKGFILGITTMGLPAASFIFVPILSKLLGAGGLSKAFLIIGIFIIVLGVASIFWVKDTPQEVGLLPNNGKYPDFKNAVAGQTHNWTIKKLLRSKNSWLIAVAYGLLFLVTTGMVSQTVVYLLQNGFEQSTAVALLSLAAAIGVIGSFIWGVLDDKLGTKTASIIYAIWYIITFAFIATASSKAICIVGIVLLGTSLGGIGNLMPSMIMSAFGVAEFAAVSRVTQTLVYIIKAFAFLVMAIGLAIFGSYKPTAWILLGITVVALICIIFIKIPDKKQINEAKNDEA